MSTAARKQLRFVADQCPLPGSDVPSLHHTHWHAEGQNRPGTYTLHADGYTVHVFQTRFMSWFRSFTVNPPPRPPSRSLITVHEWLPKYQPAKTPGWHRFGKTYTWAYAKLHPDYLQDWRSQAKRHLKDFKKSGCELRLGTKTDIEKLYTTSQVPSSIKKPMLGVLDKHLRVHPDSIDILVAAKDGLPIACFVTGNCDEAKLSEYIIGAFHPDYTKAEPMVGLIDWWYRRSLERGYTTLTFGHMETPSLFPASGDGYSYFKTQFGIERRWLPINHWRLYI